MKKNYFLLFFLFFAFTNINAQVNLSVYSEISIVTAGPGEELYEKFGHSAIRIKDPVLNLDIIYNYGIFDFNAPNFYTNFAQGKMYYLLARYDFKYFLNSYKKDKRWVKQQVLNLNQQEKQVFFKYLEKNALKDNATYLYDPFFNNCATKIRDITNIVFNDKVKYYTNNKIEKNTSLRALMNKEILWNTWGNLGINLITGTILDQKRTQEEYLYLPDYVYHLFKKATVTDNGKEKNLVKREDVLLDFKEKETTFSISSPIFIFSIISLLGLLITFRDFKKKKRTIWLDFIVLFITGLIGLILLYLWLFSSHKTAPNNFNILWAFAPNIFMAFLVLKENKKNWFKFYFYTLIGLLAGVSFLWIFKIQLFPATIIPILLFLLIRYLCIANFLLTSKK